MSQTLEAQRRITIVNGMLTQKVNEGDILVDGPNVSLVTGVCDMLACISGLRRYDQTVIRQENRIRVNSKYLLGETVDYSKAHIDGFNRRCYEIADQMLMEAGL